MSKETQSPAPQSNGNPAPENTRRRRSAAAKVNWHSLLKWAPLAILLVWTFLLLCFPMFDTDIWWHLKTGELILKDGKLPQVDWYTFTDYERPWIDLHWGFQILMALLYRAGGVNLLILAKAAVLTAAIAVAWSAGGRNLPIWGKTLIWILPVICITWRGYERPEMLSLLFLAGWMWIVLRLHERPRLIWFLPLLQVVWVNCHALFVLGLVVGVSYVVDCVARDMAQGRFGLAPPTPNPAARSIIWAGALVVIAGFVNPYFEEGALFPLTLYRKFTVDQAFYSKHVDEFTQPIRFLQMTDWSKSTDLYVRAELGAWCLAAVSFLWLFVHRRRWSVLRLMLFVGFSNLAWEAVRNSNIFSIMAGVIACENLSEVFATNEETASRPWRTYPALGVVALLAGLIMLVVTDNWNPRRKFALGETPNWYCHEAAKFAGQRGFPQRAFVAQFGQAPVYIFHNYPSRLVFMDARLEVCTRKTFELYNSIMEVMATNDTRWQKIFQKEGAELPAIILDSRTARKQINVLAQTPGWRLVFADRTAAVFLSDEQADKLSLRKADIRPLWYPDGKPRAE